MKEIGYGLLTSKTVAKEIEIRKSALKAKSEDPIVLLKQRIALDFMIQDSPMRSRFLDIAQVFIC